MAKYAHSAAARWSTCGFPKRTAICELFPSDFRCYFPTNEATQPQQPYGQPYQQPQQGSIDLAALHRDIEHLITSARADFARNPLDPSIQQRLKALLDLQSILQRQQLPEDQLRLIRDQVSQLSATAPAPRPVSTMPAPSVPAPAPAPVMTNPPPPVPTPQPAIPANLQALFNPNTLAELIRATTNAQTRTPPPPIPQPITQPNPAPISAPASTAPAATAAENPLIASLRARGLLPPTTGAPVAPTPPPNLPFILPGQAGFTTGTPPMPPVQPVNVKINVQMSSASIRM